MNGTRLMLHAGSCRQAFALFCFFLQFAAFFSCTCATKHPPKAAYKENCAHFSAPNTRHAKVKKAHSLGVRGDGFSPLQSSQGRGLVRGFCGLARRLYIVWCFRLLEPHRRRREELSAMIVAVAGPCKPAEHIRGVRTTLRRTRHDCPFSIQQFPKVTRVGSLPSTPKFLQYKKILARN